MTKQTYKHFNQNIQQRLEITIPHLAVMISHSLPAVPLKDIEQHLHDFMYWTQLYRGVEEYVAEKLLKGDQLDGYRSAQMMLYKALKDNNVTI